MNNDEALRFLGNIRDIASRYLVPVKEDTGNSQMALKTEAAHGVECLVALSAIFKAAQTGYLPFVVQGFTSLIFGLDRNQFWSQYNGTLMPVIQMGFNGFVTHLRLEVDQHKTPEKELLSQQQKKLWLQIFPTAVGCMYGHPKMLENSHALLQELERVV